MHRALIGHAIARDPTLSTPMQDTAHELELGPLVGPITKELHSIMLKSCTAIGLPKIPEVDLQLHPFPLATVKRRWGTAIPESLNMAVTASMSERSLVAVV